MKGRLTYRPERRQVHPVLSKAFLYREEGEVKAEKGMEGVLVGKPSFGKCVFLIRKVSASVTVVTPPSWVLHPLPQGHTQLGPSSGNHPWQKGFASRGPGGGEAGLV